MKRKKRVWKKQLWTAEEKARSKDPERIGREAKRKATGRGLYSDSSVIAFEDILRFIIEAGGNYIPRISPGSVESDGFHHPTIQLAKGLDDDAEKRLILFPDHFSTKEEVKRRLAEYMGDLKARTAEIGGVIIPGGSVQSGSQSVN
jgi:hypothetical protein